ncbi:MAG: TonB-dependent receptor [Pyrinomonadaceae bacterium]
MKNQLALRKLLYSLLLLLISHTAVLAQYTEGSISGTVTDSSGDVLAGANVVVTNSQTGEARQTITDSDGLYRVASLRPGVYEIKVEQTGFKTSIVKNIQVVVNTVVRADAQLEPGAIAETIVVTSDASLVNTEEGRVADTLNTRQVQELPLNGRDINQLALLQPGVTATLAPVISNTQFNRFNFGFSANGATPRGNNYVLDGVSNNNEWLGGTPAISPSVELIQEFQVQTVNFSAEYGRNNGAVVVAISRSGTNQFHGSLYDFIRNDALDAKNFFDNPTDPTVLIQNQFGGSFGGPIRKDRTFFFGNYEGLRTKEGRTSRGIGETPEFRAQVAAIRPNSLANRLFNTYPSPPCVAGTARDVASIFRPNLPIEQVRLIPFYEFIEGPRDGIVDTCQVSFLDRRDIRGDQYSVRVDHQFSDDDKLFARGLGDKRRTDSGREQLGGAVRRGFKAPFKGDFPSFLAGYTHLFSSKVVNDLRFSYSRSDFGIGFEAPNSDSNDFPTLFFDDGVTRFGGAIFVPREFVFDTFIVNDTFSVSRGNHNIKFGAEVKRIFEDSDYKLDTLGFYEFDSLFGFANDAAYYQEALVDPRTGNFTGTPRQFRWTQLGAFVQDDWKVSRKLTLNLGLRYDYFGVPTEADGILSNIILGTGGTFGEQVANAFAGRVERIAESDKNNFAPRVGFAYDLAGDGKTAIRGSYAVAYLEAYSNLYTNASRFGSPDSATPVVFPLFFGGTVVYDVPAAPSPDFQTGLTPRGGIPGTRISIPGVQADLRTAYSQQWFLGVQRQLRGSLYLSANYVGTSGKKLYIRNDINRFTGDRASRAEGPDRFNQEWTGTFYVQNGNSSIYHGANVQLQKRYSSSFMFTFNYTLGKSIDVVSDPGLGDFINVSVGGYTGTQDAANTGLDRAPSDFDVRQRIALHGLWDIPSPKGPKALRAIFGGWQANLIGTYQTGRPFSVTCASTINCDFNGDGNGYDRPNTPSFGNSLSDLSRSDFLNGIFRPSDFPQPTFGTNGNLGRNTFRGPDFASVDVSLFKNIPLTEAVKLQFRAEAFNVFNRVNLFLPNAGLSTLVPANLGQNPLTFGQSTAAFDPRQLQFALKLIF